jgi:hypothetical protein
MSILAALVEVARIFVDKAGQKSRDVGAPKGIADSFVIHSPIQSETKYEIEIGNKHPAAAAYELGSGIHATVGNAGKYPIVPKNKDFLAFLWPKVEGDPSFRRLPDGRVLLPSVEHPGVEAKPYLMPTFNENKVEFKRILGKGFKAELLTHGKKVEVIEVK